MEQNNKGRTRPHIRNLCQSPMLTVMDDLSGSADLPTGGEHDYIFIICTRGSFEFRAGRDYYFLSEGESLLIRSFGLSSEICYPSEGCGVAFMLIDRREVFFISAQLIFDKLANGSGIMMALDPEAREVFEKLCNDARALGEEYTKHKCEELILLMCLEAGRSPADSRACTEEQLALARRAGRLITSDLSKRLTISELAQGLGVSETRLKATFQRVFGRPVYAYTKTVKMKKAASLLLGTNMNILDIAGVLGYDNGSKFSEAFRSIFGLSPREERASYRSYRASDSDK